MHRERDQTANDVGKTNLSGLETLMNEKQFSLCPRTTNILTYRPILYFASAGI